MYTGWIPNVSGYLSFSHIGGIAVRNRTFEEDVYPPTKFLQDASHISLVQERNLSDRPTIGTLSRLTKRGHLVFLLQAEVKHSSSVRQLVGIIYCLPYALSDELYRLHESAKQGAAPAVNGKAAAQLISNIRVASGEAIFALSFALCDDGVVELQSLANAEANDEGGRLRAFEAYSFLKDVLHRHRFHSPADDALLELTPCVISDPLWAEHVARNLHRSVISSFRSISPSAQIDGLGKLSYLESFTKICERRAIPIRQSISIDSLKSALSAHQARGSMERDEQSLFVTFFLSIAAIALPVLFICLQLLQIPCIEGFTHSEACNTRFVIEPNIVTLTGFVLARLAWVILATIIFATVALLLLKRKQLLSYNSGKLNLSTWTTDLRDLVFRVSISSRLLALCLLAATGYGIYALAWSTIRRLLQ